MKKCSSIMTRFFFFQDYKLNPGNSTTELLSYIPRPLYFFILRPDLTEVEAEVEVGQPPTDDSPALPFQIVGILRVHGTQLRSFS